MFKDPEGGLSFDTQVLEELLIDSFGTTMRMKDVRHPKYMEHYNDNIMCIYTYYLHY